MKDAIKQITDALDQQMELNFLFAGKLIELSPADSQKQLKKELHSRLSLLRERTLEAKIALEQLVERGDFKRNSLASSIINLLKRSV